MTFGEFLVSPVPAYVFIVAVFLNFLLLLVMGSRAEEAKRDIDSLWYAVNHPPNRLDWRVESLEDDLRDIKRKTWKYRLVKWAAKKLKVRL